MNKRSILLSALLAGGILSSAGLPARALPAPAPQETIANPEAAPPMIEKAYWHRYWHRHYWHRGWHRHHWHHWRRW